MFEFDINRINRLREEALNAPISHDKVNLLFYTRLKNNESLGDDETRFGDAFEYAFENLEPVINKEDEMIVGKIYHGLETEEERQQWKELADTYVRDVHACYGQESHMTVDYVLLLKKGLRGIAEDIRSLISEGKHPESINFYKCCLQCLEAVRKLSNNYGLKAERMAAEAETEKRKKELELIAKTVKKVPYEPAESFFEAVQSVSFLTYCISMDTNYAFTRPQFQLGRIDRYLREFYENDLKKGIITKENARMILDLLGIQINNRVPSGLSSGYMVGGRDENGFVTANDLTELGMQVVDDIRLVYPAVGLCYTKDMPEKYLDKATEILSHGRSHPAIFGDDTISEGLGYYGVSPEERRNYIHSTCVEITPIAASNIWVASPYTNMPQLLLDIMDREYGSFEDLKDRYLKYLSERIKINLDNEIANRRIREKKGHHPLVSCFVNDCLKEGKDLEKYGSRYNWIMPSFVGVANLVDSLYVIKKEIFESKNMTVKEMREILSKNYEGYENIRQKFLNYYVKYGNDNEEIDKYVGEITGFLVSECEKYEGYYKGFKLIPSVFCWIMHTVFGRDTGATPDGRKAGFPLGDGSGPCQGREKNGPTASVLSSTSWKHMKLIGGVAVNLKFSKKVFNENSGKNLKAIIKEYIDRGGFEIQINVVDKDTLLEARKNPDNYRDLVVRIGGYSDYFVRLCPEMQEEVILRTAHEI